MRSPLPLDRGHATADLRNHVPAPVGQAHQPRCCVGPGTSLDVASTLQAREHVIHGLAGHVALPGQISFYSPMLGLRTEIETATRFRKTVGDHADAAWRELTRDAREVSQD